ADADDLPAPPAPDLAPCDACLAELADPGSRHHRNPFVACAVCGPRFSVAVPPRSCEACRAERDDPAGRRHGGPWVSCRACGPHVEFADADGQVTTADAAIENARMALAEGRIVAVKGVGGYQLACDANDTAAVERLRRRR